MRRPPLVVVFISVLVIALGESAGALMTRLRPQIERYARARVAANPQAHGLAGSAEYDAEVAGRAVYTAEAGLSFFHTHAQGLGPLAIFVSTIAASAVPWRRARGGIYALLGIGALFPMGYLAYALAALEWGREAGVEGVERYVLAPLGSAVIVALVALAALLLVAARRKIRSVTREPGESWRLPPVASLLAAVLLIACAEVGGASMVRFKLDLARWARSVILARPAIHGLVGVRDVDEQVIDEALVKFDASLRLFHLHAEGMGLVIIATTMTAATLASAGASRRALLLLLTAGGAGYPFGYLLWGALIPYQGLERAKVLAEWLVWIPFGGATIIATWWLAALVAARMVRRA